MKPHEELIDDWPKERFDVGSRWSQEKYLIWIFLFRREYENNYIYIFFLPSLQIHKLLQFWWYDFVQGTICNMHKLILDNLRVYDNRGVRIHGFDVQKFPWINTIIVKILKKFTPRSVRNIKYSNPAKLDHWTKAPFLVFTIILLIIRVSHTVLV